MERPEETSRNLYSLAIRFCYDLCEELEYHRSSRKYLTFDDYKILKTYYNKLSYGTVKYIAHSHARLLKYIIYYIKLLGDPRLLDTGCGLGSEAIFFSLLGADVVGVDLNRERLDVANKRVKYYEEKYNKALRVKFYLKNVLGFCECDKFDIVWSNQSISHIHPVQDFLKVAWKKLKNGGYLIICDSNNLNPYVAFLAWLVHRKGGLLTLAEDPNTFKPIPYARERLLNPSSLSNLLKQTCYNTELVKFHGFVPTRFNIRRFFRFADETLTNLSLIRLMGGSYIVIGRKVPHQS